MSTFINNSTIADLSDISLSYLRQQSKYGGLFIVDYCHRLQLDYCHLSNDCLSSLENIRWRCDVYVEVSKIIITVFFIFFQVGIRGNFNVNYVYLFNNWVNFICSSNWCVFRGHLVTENLVNALSFGLATWHLLNSYLGWPEVMSVEKCHVIVSLHGPLIILTGWFTILISIDRFIAVTKPLSYEGR